MARQREVKILKRAPEETYQSPSKIAIGEIIRNFLEEKSIEGIVSAGAEHLTLDIPEMNPIHVYSYNRIISVYDEASFRIGKSLAEIFRLSPELKHAEDREHLSNGRNGKKFANRINWAVERTVVQ